MLINQTIQRLMGAAFVSLSLAACVPTGPELPPATYTTDAIEPSEEYRIGALDEITIHVWRNPELSAENVRVRPDGRLTIPLVRDIPAVGKTATELQTYIAEQLAEYIEQPIVSVIVNTPEGTYDQRVKVVGSTEQPASLPYQANMTVLDAMIAVGGLSEFAAGNRAKLIRLNRETGSQEEYRLRLSDLLKRGDSTANVLLKPGDTIIIPESRF
ncbi:XrtA/PEP-CTERM system exopolysaccharide export protein [Erythrobacter sp. YT30]|uniref:XrtA/PEP-CTERM system exopolysaccharide export protein n=1 Tax=Erythrobacter sp. YT30 TaxID=1735012 RepID=UPI00076D81CE|nr:XrtA/PEP-CTERM system exopolysaccharide export protein [Erythrobacter sp. YT30]KWV93080.1 polysaccharide export protein [Erythrobacter sp. YT30]